MLRVVALILVVVVAVMFGIDLINGRWDQPHISPRSSEALDRLR